MIPIVTPDEMRAIDAAAPEPTEVLIGRAGAEVARHAAAMLGGTYGRRVAVIAGKGNNGADGRVAGELLAQRGAQVTVLDPLDPPWRLPPMDLVIDAAYGTGFHGTWDPPNVGDAAVLAVDIPSGVDALTGVAAGPVLRATRTVTFAAYKPGLLIGAGPGLAGEVVVADIGLRAGPVFAHLLEADDVGRWWPRRSADAHKWKSALRVIAGSPTMTGAAALVSASAMRGGCGMVQLSIPGQVSASMPTEVVQAELPHSGWAAAALTSLQRFTAAAIGPGLGRGDDTGEQVRAFVAGAELATVIDGDGLFAVGWNADGAAATLHQRSAPTVLTPHDGEYTTLTGTEVGADRIVAARRLAHDTDSVVLLKGSATVVAHPHGDVLVVNTGDSRLASAGTGDVLTGLIGALLAAGAVPFRAAAMGAWLHGMAARRCPRYGTVASDVVAAIPATLAELLDPGDC